MKVGVAKIPDGLFRSVVPLARAVEARGFDSLSEGRFLFSIGAGWNAEELENHGVAFADRWKVLRESVLAMKARWPNYAAPAKRATAIHARSTFRCSRRPPTRPP